jgi:hypothetical protein
MRIDSKRRQSEKTLELIQSSAEFGANVTVRRDAQHSKHPSGRTLTPDGIQIDSSDEHCQNAEVQIYTSCESLSKEISWSDAVRQKP